MTKPKLITVRITRAEFLKLPMPARRRILEEQSAKLLQAMRRERERRKQIVYGLGDI